MPIASATIAARADALRWHLLLTCLLVLPPALGSLGAYMALFAGLLYAPELLRRQTWADIAAEPVYRWFAAALIALFIVFCLTAREWTDTRHVFNFAVLLLAAILYPTLSARAGPAGLRTFACHALAGSAVALGTAMIVTWGLGEPRASSFIEGNPLHFAHNASMLGWLAPLGMFAVQGRRRWLFALGPAFGLGATVLADARGVLLAYPLLALVALVLIGTTLTGRQRITLWLGAGATLLVAFGLVLTQTRLGAVFGIIAELFGSGASSDESASQRLAMWQAGWAAFRQSPLIGHGWEHYMAESLAQVPAATRETLARYSHLHNDLVDFAAAGGLVGIGAYMVFLLAPVGAALRRQAWFIPRLYGIGTLCLGFALYGLTNKLMGYETQTYLYGMGIALVLALTRRPVDRAEA